MGDERSNDSLSGIAVIGMSGRFPRASNLDEYWHNLQEGVECISTFSDEELQVSGVDPALINNPSYVKRKAFLEDIELFDAPFFGFNPGEAEVIDPQHRLFLESASEVLDNAGYTAEGYAGLIGVYAGCSLNSYLISNLLSNTEVIQRLGAYQIMIGNDKDFLSTRVSYKLNLKGPSLSVQTACSTSLVAVHLACQSLLNYECDMAIAGGVSIGVPQKTGYLFQEGMILSPDGRCRAFDAKAQGMVGGEGVGVVLLKRLTDALSDGDNIRAVIKGSAINNDGSLKAGYTAPSIDGQAEVITAAQTAAGINAETISYVETHGTGTSLGDPIEVAALTKAFRYTTQKKRFCAIGSVKTNIGHLDIAAGVASLIKTVLALQHKRLPPSLHFENPNPLIDFDNSPFFVNASLLEWKAGESPRRAGVSSFGIGGTNAHLVVEEAPDREPSGSSRPWKILSLSAKSENSLATMTQELVEQLKREKNINLADVAYTLQVGRRKFGHRRIAVCQTREDAISTLDSLDPTYVRTNVNESDERPVAFMFSGQGSQYVNMTYDLYQKEAKFREVVDFCADFLKSHIECDLRSILYPDENSFEDAGHRLTQTAITQPALFVVEYALAMLWMEWGISPQAMIGHSIGEYVAACLSGVFSLEEALALVAARGRLVQSLPGGAMMAVAMTEKEVCSFLNGKLSLAAVNSSSSCVVSGETDAVRAMENELTGKGVGCVHLHTSHAFHSQMMDPIISEFARHVRKIDLKPPQIKYVSNVTGKWITQAEATDPEYWAKHIRQTVRFADGIIELLKDPAAILLEVGPGRTLATLAEQQPMKSIDRVVLSCVRHPKEKVPDDEFLINILGRLWLEGVRVDWQGFYGNERRYRVALPAYPFERQRYWIEPKAAASLPVIADKQYIQKKSEISDWFYIPSWKRFAIPKEFEDEPQTERKTCWLVFLDQMGLGNKLVRQLLSDGNDVVSVIIGESFRRVDQNTYAINPHSKSDYDDLFRDLSAFGKAPRKIVHMWNVSINSPVSLDAKLFEASQHLGFYSLLFLARNLGDFRTKESIVIYVISNNMLEVSGEEVLRPELSTVLGPCKTIPQEYHNIKCCNIDISCNTQDDLQKNGLVTQLLQEIAVETSGTVVAYRHQHRWVQTFDAIQLGGTIKGTPMLLREGGVYLITGGIGGIGLVLAEYLARTVKAKLILIGRTPLPPKEKWSEWIETHSELDEVGKKLRKLKAFEDVGAEILFFSADVADLGQMQAVVDASCDRFGTINGAVHAAGIIGNEVFLPISEIIQIECEKQFRPKVLGLFVLEKVLGSKSLDFCLLTSSISCVLGGLGFAMYSAANLFMDAFTLAYRLRSNVPWVSVNWDAWRFSEKISGDLDWGSNLAELAITPEEGVDVFGRILSRQTVPQIIVSTGNLQARIDRYILRNGPNKPDTSKKQDEVSSRHSRTGLSTEYIAPRNEIERAVAEIWQELLNIEKIGVNDNFFALGGHSLLGTQVMSRIYQLFNVQLPLRKLFEVETVEGLARLIESVNYGSNGEASDASLQSEDREIIEI